EEVRVAPDVLGAALDAPPPFGDVAARLVAVGDLERAEAALAHVQRLERVLRPAFSALESFCRHLKPPLGCGEGPEKNSQPHLPGFCWSLMELAPSPLSREVAGVSTGQSLHPSG